VSLLGIESVLFAVDDLGIESRFFTDFGLAEQDSTRSGSTFATEEGSTVVLRREADRGVPAQPSAGMTLREVQWGVSDHGALDLLATRLADRAEVTESADGVIRTTDPAGLSIALSVSTIDRAQFERVDPNADRAIGQRAELPDRAAPFHFGHVVLKGADAAMQSFYCDTLGFRVSDWNPLGVFLRCDGATNHHNLLLMNGGELDVHHISFRVSGIDELMVGKERMEDLGWQWVWGPGRHPIGSQLFCYFAHPAGGLIEYHAGEDRVVGDNWEPRHFDAQSALAWGGKPA
jgi:catechol 2,3-dioxygenase-like lactoylglutathione lyase family enzyme